MKSGKKASGAPSWMVTFADMMSLLLALFVLMLSFSVTDAQRYKQIVGSMHDAFGLQQFRRLAGIFETDGNPARDYMRGTTPAPSIDMPLQDWPAVQEPEEDPVEDGHPADAPTPQPATARHPALDKLMVRLKKERADTLISIGQRDNRIVVSFPDTAAFPSGSAVLTDRFQPVLDKLASILVNTSGEIVVAGHTDSTPISTERFRSNWDLSTARAVSVVHYWLKHSRIEPARLTAEGHGDSRPLYPNDTPGHRAANRRVEISIRVQ